MKQIFKPLLIASLLATVALGADAQGIGPMTTLGDLIYGAASGAATRLAGNTSAQKEYLQSLGAGGYTLIKTEDGPVGDWE